MYPLFDLPTVAIVGSNRYTKVDKVNIEPKTTTHKTYNFTSEEIQGFIGQPAALLDNLLLKYPSAFMPHAEALRAGILASYSQHDQVQLIKSLELITGIDSAQSLPMPEPSPVEGQAQNTAPHSVTFVSGSQPAPYVASVIDADSLRIAVLLKEMPVYRVWVFAHQLSRESDNSAKLDRAELEAYLLQHEIVLTNSSFRNLIERGNGQGKYAGKVKYWNLSPDGQVVYLTSGQRLNERYASYLRRKKRFEAIDTNRPGNRRILVDLHGGIAEVEARAFNAWMSLAAERHEKKHKSYEVEISLPTLRDLFGRSPNTLRAWIKLAGIKTRRANAESDPSANDEYTETRERLIPSHAYPILTKSGKQLDAWQLPNTYTPKPVLRHTHAGNRHKVRRAVNGKLFQPADLMHGGFQRSAPTKRIYFHDTWQIRKANGHFTENRVDGYKKLRSHLKHHQDVLSRRHYVQIGKRRYWRKTSDVFEYSTGNLWRSPDDRDFKAERSPEFQALRRQYRAARMDMKNA